MEKWAKTALYLLLAVFTFATYQLFRHARDPATQPEPAPTTAKVTAPIAETTPSTLPLDDSVADLIAQEQAVMKQIQLRFAAGDYEATLKLAQQQLEQPNTSEALRNWLKGQLPAILTSIGWLKLKLKDCDQATTYFKQSEALLPTIEARKGLAYCAYQSGNISDGLFYAEQYLKEANTDREMMVLLADMLESDQRFDEAVEWLERAQSLEVNRDEELQDQLKDRLSTMKARQQESGYQLTIQFGAFNLSYRPEDHEELLPLVQDTLSRAYDEFVERYRFREVGKLIDVILYPSDKFQSVVVNGPEWAQGIFDGRMRIPVHPDQAQATKNREILVRVLRHELVHALLSAQSGDRQLPPWFNEGLAQRLECNIPGCGQIRFPTTKADFLPAEDFSKPYIQYSQMKARRSYVQSLFLVLTLEQKFTEEDVLARMIAAIQRNTPLTSEALLQTTQLEFGKVYATAKELWEQGEILSW